MHLPSRRSLLRAAARLAPALLLALPALSAAPAGALKVVATIPDLADITREVGGDRVDVTSITKGRENLHRVVARPSHLVALSRADALVEIGLSLEVGFLPGLLENARNPRIAPGAPGLVNCSQGWEAIDVPESVSRKEGDIHPDGNPHINMDPRGGRHIAERVLLGLEAVDPAGKEAYEARAAAYRKKLDEAEARWAKAGAAWKGRKVVVYHQEFDYLARRYGLDVLGTVEVKPGIPPTPGHVAELIAAMRKAGDVVILTAPWSNGGDVEEIAKKAGARVVELPNQCGGGAGTDTWIGMMDVVHQRLAAAFGTDEGAR